MYVCINAATYANCQIDAAKWLQTPQGCSYQDKALHVRLHFKVYGDFSKNINPHAIKSTT